jgi:hypothetical protein
MGIAEHGPSTLALVAGASTLAISLNSTALAFISPLKEEVGT